MLSSSPEVSAMSDSLIAKSMIVITFAAILLSLGYAFISMMRRKKQDDNKTVKALTIRVFLSVALVVTILVLNSLGVISPNG